MVSWREFADRDHDVFFALVFNCHLRRSLGWAMRGLMLVCLANPLLLEPSSILAPIAARAFSEEGKIGVRRVVSKYLLIVTVLLIGFAGILSLTGDTLLRIILDASYQGNQSTINV